MQRKQKKHRSPWDKGLRIPLGKPSYKGKGNGWSPVTFVRLLSALHSPQISNTFLKEFKKTLMPDKRDREACAAYKAIYLDISQAIESGDSDFFKRFAEILDVAKERIVALHEDSAEKELLDIYYEFRATYRRNPTRKEAKRIAINRMIEREIDCTKECSNYRDKKAAVEESFNWNRAFNRLINIYPSEKIGRKRVRTPS